MPLQCPRMATATPLVDTLTLTAVAKNLPAISPCPRRAKLATSVGSTLPSILRPKSLSRPNTPTSSFRRILTARPTLVIFLLSSTCLMRRESTAATLWKSTTTIDRRRVNGPTNWVGNLGDRTSCGGTESLGRLSSGVKPISLFGTCVSFCP